MRCGGTVYHLRDVGNGEAARIAYRLCTAKPVRHGRCKRCGAKGWREVDLRSKPRG